MSDEVEAFFRTCESGGSLPEGPEWLGHLARAHADEIAFELGKAEVALAAASVPEGPFREVASLIKLRVDVRRASQRGLADAVAPIAELAKKSNALAVRTRAHHLLAVANIRLGRLDEAEESISRAIETVPADSVALLWMIDTLAQILIGQGAWSEATRTLNALVERRKDDRIGLAISAGHLIRLHTSLGKFAEAAALADVVLTALRSDDPVLTRLRIHTLRTGALLEMADRPRLAAALEALDALVAESTAEQHYLVGYALLTAARARGILGQNEQSGRALAAAREQFELASHVALLRYHEACLDPTLFENQAFIAAVEELWAEMDFVSEGEILFRLEALRKAGALHDRGNVRTRFGALYARMSKANNPLWMRWIDELAEEIDPSFFGEQIAIRYSGRPRGELATTKREDATIVFSDLVNFTARSLVLPPEEIMETVRGLFQLGVPIMSKHRILPLTYMGDGLLAIAQGAGHEGRALAYAHELVARTGRLSRLRKVLGTGWPLDIRAGAASGPVVLGALGTLYKTDFAAIGATTNLAARLQAAAEPGQVVCAATTAAAAGVESAQERLQLKGYESTGGVMACRFRVSESTDSAPTRT